MSIYASFGIVDGDEPGSLAPIIYQQSHVLPTMNDPRGGSIALGLIPGFITRDGRDRTGRLVDPDDLAGTDDEGVYPFLRVSVTPVQPPAEARRLARKQRLFGLVLRWWSIRLKRRVPRWSWPEDTVVLDRDQVERLRDDLSDWLLRCDDPDRWLEQRGKSAPIALNGQRPCFARGGC